MVSRKREKQIEAVVDLCTSSWCRGNTPEQSKAECREEALRCVVRAVLYSVHLPCCDSLQSAGSSISIPPQYPVLSSCLSTHPIHPIAPPSHGGGHRSGQVRPAQSSPSRQPIAIRHPPSTARQINQHCTCAALLRWSHLLSPQPLKRSD